MFDFVANSTCDPRVIHSPIQSPYSCHRCCSPNSQSAQQIEDPPRYENSEMSKKQFKSQASSGRVGGGFGAFGGSGFGSSQSSQLSYIQEPPDYSGISDANVVVAFKNLSKKDSTTKAKALEDIQAYVSSDIEVEEGLLEAWVRSKSTEMRNVVDSDEHHSGQTLPAPLH